ncbi:MAG: nucleoside-diphosphate kinase [Firmicutes bacterium]|nr:nucleoside-diphosphate kinase [Bacillota bacterium]
MERTYIMIKPDAIKRGLMGEIITRIEHHGYKITNAKMFNMTEEVLNEHYSHIMSRSFYPEIVAYMQGGPVLGMVVEGKRVIEGMRILMGATKYLEAAPGTIRGDYSFMDGENLIHGSDSAENAEIEIKRFFGKNA